MKPVIFVPGLPASELLDAVTKERLFLNLGLLISKTARQTLLPRLEGPNDTTKPDGVVAGLPLADILDLPLLDVGKVAQSLYDILRTLGYTGFRPPFGSPELVTLPCYQWNRVVITPQRHPLAKMNPLTVEALAKFPIVTYDFSFTGRSAINAAFAAKGLEPNVVLTALDSDVIKTYVELGMGVGIIAQMAYDPERDTQFEKLDADHLFAPSTTRLGLRYGVFLRGYVYAFISLFAPRYDRAAIDAALEGRNRR